MLKGYVGPGLRQGADADLALLPRLGHILLVIRPTLSLLCTTLRQCLIWDVEAPLNALISSLRQLNPSVQKILGI